MTLVYMEGFESVIDTPDMISRGWKMGGSLGSGGQNALTLPSRTGVAGRGLMLRGPYYPSATYLPLINSSAYDFGMIDTGKSINDLWKAGGFAVGFNATFNKRQQTEVAMGMPSQIVYDGSQYYWAIVNDNTTSGGYATAYSTDLMNWTLTTNKPAVAGLDAFIEVVGSGPNATVIVGRQLQAYNTYSYYTTNMGLTWSQQTSGQSFGHNLIATGNPATPLVGITQNGSTTSATAQLYYLTAMGGTPVAIAGITLATGQYTTGAAKVVSGVACFSSVAGGNLTNPGNYAANWYCCPTSADMTKSTNYTSSPTHIGQALDITFFNNVWISVGYSGIFTAPNSGTVGSPLGPTGAWTRQVASLAPGVFSVDHNGSICVAVGADTTTSTVGAIYTSTDGVTWSKVNRFILEGAGGNNGVFTNVIWDGKQFVVTGGLNNNMVLTSADGLNWTPVYYPDYTEYSGTPASLLGIYSGTLVAGVNAGGNSGAPGTYVPYTSTATYHVGVGLYAAAPVTTQSGTTRQVQVGNVTGSGAVGLQALASAVSTAQLTHFYEIIATAIPGTSNAFTFQWAVDGVIVGTLALTLQNGAFAVANDTAAHLLLNLGRSGQWTVIDDIYVTTMNGSSNVGQLGPVNILPWTPVSDVQAAMTRNGNAASNAAQVAGALSNSEGSVYSYTVGAQDVYKTAATIPAGYKIKGVQAEAFFTKYGTSGANCSMGIISGTVEVDSAVVTANTNTPTYAALIAETDPNTNAAWTSDGVKAAEMTVTKVN
jgi:hypothetical protein